MLLSEGGGSIRASGGLFQHALVRDLGVRIEQKKLRAYGRSAICHMPGDVLILCERASLRLLYKGALRMNCSLWPVESQLDGQGLLVG